MVEIHHFATWSKELLEIFLEKLQHFEEENYEIAKLPSFEMSIFKKRF
jgi:hypothetical protein